MEIPKKVELGCGKKKPEGYLGVDIVETNQTDEVINLDQSNWDLPSNHFTHIRAIDLFEHLENPMTFIEEVYRIAENGAVIEVRAPHRSSQNWTDPTHERLVGVDTMDNYFTTDGTYGFYSEADFDVIKKG